MSWEDQNDPMLLPAKVCLADFLKKLDPAEIFVLDFISTLTLENVKLLSMEVAEEMRIILKHIRNAKRDAEVIQNV